MYKYSESESVDSHVDAWVARQRALAGGFNRLDTPQERLTYTCEKIAQSTRLARLLRPRLSDTLVSKREHVMALNRMAPAALGAYKRLYDFTGRYARRNYPEFPNSRHILGGMTAQDLINVLCYLGHWNRAGKVWRMSAQELNNCYEASDYRGSHDISRYYEQVFDNQWPITRTVGVRRLSHASTSHHYVAHIDLIIWSFCSPVHMPSDNAFRVVPRTVVIQTRAVTQRLLTDAQDFMRRAIQVCA